MTVHLAQELDRIAERVATLAQVVASLREENHAMRHTLDQRDSENRLLRDRLETARERVDTLITRLSTDA